MNKENFLEKYVVDRKGTDSFKWDWLNEKFGKDGMISMWVADMEFKVCDGITASLQERVNHGVYGYSKVSDDYAEIFSSWMERHHNFPIKEEWLRYTTGSVTSIAYMVNTFTQPGEGVLILTPVYYPFASVINNNKRKLVDVPLNNVNGRFEMDFDRIEKAVVENQAKLYIHCSPANPVGRVWTDEEQDKLFEICEKHGVLIISDEIHQDLIVGDIPFVPAANVNNGKYRDIIVTLNSGSKTFNLASLLMSHVIITNPELMAKYDEFAGALNRTAMSSMGMLATKAGYKTGDEWLKNVIEVIKDNYEYMKKEFAENLPKIVLTPLEGTYLSFLDLRAYVDKEETKDFVQNKCNLAVDYGEWFSEDYKGFIRINLATDPKFVKQACDSIIREAKKL